MAQDMANFGEWYNNLEKNVYSSDVGSHILCSIRLILLILLFTYYMSLLALCVLSVTDRDVLKISLFQCDFVLLLVLSICFIHIEAMLIDAYIFKLSYILGDSLSLFSPSNTSYFNFYFILY